ncbi:MAG: hypothetical protein HFJ80_01975 [Clostridiales bacterium]|nr:hypothetical protein [Clostridiales bacterium]
MKTHPGKIRILSLLLAVLAVGLTGVPLFLLLFPHPFAGKGPAYGLPGRSGGLLGAKTLFVQIDTDKYRVAVTPALSSSLRMEEWQESGSVPAAGRAVGFHFAEGYYLFLYPSLDAACVYDGYARSPLVCRTWYTLPAGTAEAAVRLIRETGVEINENTDVSAFFYPPKG